MGKKIYTVAIAVLSVAAVVLAGTVAGLSLPAPENGSDTSDSGDSPASSVFDLTGTVLTSYDEDTKSYMKYDATGDYTTLTGWYHSWSSGGKTYTVDLSFTYEDVSAYRTADADRRYVSGDAGANIKYATSADATVKALASKLMGLYGISDITAATAAQLQGYANFILDFSQSFTYQTDEAFISANGSELASSAGTYFISGTGGGYEYWKYALETLYDRAGDCEDTSLLCAAIAEASGLDAALVLLPGHAVAAIALDSVVGGAYYYVDGKYYFYSETTSDSYVVGTASMRYDGTVITVPDEGSSAVEYECPLRYYNGGQNFIDGGSLFPEDVWIKFPRH